MKTMGIREFEDALQALRPEIEGRYSVTMPRNG
jgi:hypothetical protein